VKDAVASVYPSALSTSIFFMVFLAVYIVTKSTTTAFLAGLVCGVVGYLTGRKLAYRLMR